MRGRAGCGDCPGDEVAYAELPGLRMACRRRGRINVPTLVVAGGPTSHLPQHELARMAPRIPAARLVTIDAGHAVPANRPTPSAPSSPGGRSPVRAGPLR
ncbi:alpha/beta fold hydrolase [Micromonospora sp. NBS 11-29]|uniref:alpha/beta fold hydrolase n=1 Tax=Micromonospora sp. NBS 11-29 TaxID=1960879 RepID=UPI001C3957F3|nr:alpha/beta hydrolase [Micromonospora sp. NBS 11-29]